MSVDAADSFVNYLLGLDRVPKTLGPALKREVTENGDRHLRKLWELTELPAHDFADEVARRIAVIASKRPTPSGNRCA